MRRNGIAILLALVVLYSCNTKKNENFDTENLEIAACKSVDMCMAPPAASCEVAAVEFSPPSVNEVESAPNSTNSKPVVKNGSTAVVKKKIIKDGNVSVETDDVNVCKKAMDEELKKLNAYYESEDLRNLPGRISYDLKIRVPSANFEKLISDIENGNGEIRYKNIKARDVTEEYLDIESRLTNKREYLKRYKELLSRAKTVEDVLQIEENIRALQEEIESKEGRLKYLSDQVEFSTLDLHIFKEKEIVSKPLVEDKFSVKVKKSLGNGWTSVVDCTLGIIRNWPVVILLVVVAYLIRRIIKKIKNKRKVNEE